MLWVDYEKHNRIGKMLMGAAGQINRLIVIGTLWLWVEKSSVKNRAFLVLGLLPSVFTILIVSKRGEEVQVGTGGSCEVGLGFGDFFGGGRHRGSGSGVGGNVSTLIELDPRGVLHLHKFLLI